MTRHDKHFRFRPRRALVVIPLAMAVALTLTVSASYFNVREVLVAVDRDQGETFLHALRREAMSLEGALDEATLQRILRDQEEAGLRCIAAFDLDLEFMASDAVMSSTSEIGLEW